MTNNSTPISGVQHQQPQAIDGKHATGRRRIAVIHRGALAEMDSAIEARRDSEAVAADYQIRRADAQDVFAWETRRMVRQLQGELRQILRRAA